MLIEMQIVSFLQSLTFSKDSTRHIAALSAKCRFHRPECSFLDSIHPFLCPSIHGCSHPHTAGFFGTTTLSIKQRCTHEKYPHSWHMVQSNYSICHMHMHLISIYTYSVLSSSSRRPAHNWGTNK